ncbi:hypothetical protein BpHYR1_003095 [Brachionus plicatilis]|uniref:Uncharacterized protein n=1 Tax=Brachionus plicatilis TaxID=10195 RepID=A0A3M7S9V2_BRAPC|nr:hypothetical protein BpHYR1_003095 [Brachionus plicatilis]
MLFKSTICFFFFAEGLLALALENDDRRHDLIATAISSNSYISVSQLKELKAKNNEIISKLQLIETILDSYISKKENIKETLDEKINLEELINENINDILEGNINLQELLGSYVQEQDKSFRNELKQPWETLASLWNEFSKMGWQLVSFVSEQEPSDQFYHPIQLSDPFIRPRPEYPIPIPTIPPYL